MEMQRQFVEKPWGRTDIPANFGAPTGTRIGEIWYEAAGMADAAVLVKWLFTSEKLSVQVHPSDADARAQGLPSGKEECWFIADAEPGAVLGIGTVAHLSPQQLREASLSGEIEKLMDWKPVKCGDYFYIPAGTVHAIGAGIALVEVQQHADITYRLFDYGRPRELHLDDGVAVAKAEPYHDPRSGRAVGNRQLVDGPYFTLWHVADPQGVSAIPDSEPRWIVPLQGEYLGSCHRVEAGASMEFCGPMLIAVASATGS